MNFLNKAELYRKVELIRQSAPAGRFDPYTLAKSLGIEIEVYAFDSDRLAGVLMRGKHKSLIVLSANRPPEGRRFAASHELVHYFLHDGENFFCAGDDAVSAIEWQANEGAAELLMPYKEFIPLYENIRSLFFTDRERALRRAAERFGVSAGMINTRLQSLSPEIDQYERGTPLEQIVPTSARRAAAFRADGTSSCAASGARGLSAPQSAAAFASAGTKHHNYSCIDVFE